MIDEPERGKVLLTREQWNLVKPLFRPRPDADTHTTDDGESGG